MFYLFYLLRRFIIAFTFAVLYKAADVQCYILTYTSFFIWFYHVIFRPYHSKIVNVLAIINESFLCVIVSFLWVFIIQNKAITVIGWILNVVIIMLLVTNWCIIFPAKLIEIIRTCKRKCSSRFRRKPNMEYLDENEEVRKILGLRPEEKHPPRGMNAGMQTGRNRVNV